MQRLTKIIISIFFLFIPLLTLTFILQCGNTQDKIHISKSNSNKKKKEIIDQNAKELIKAKELKVKVRKRFAGFFESNGSYPKKMVLVEKVIFDEKGNRKQSIRYKSTGEVDLNYEFTYDKNGNLISMDTYDGFGNLKGRKESQYDINNKEVVRKLLNDRSSGELKTELKYDSENRLIKSINYSKDGIVISTQNYEYDGELLIKSITKDADGRQISEIIFEYDSNGYLIKETQSSIQGNNIITYKYDANGNLIEIKDKQSRRELKYDSKGNLIEDKMFLSDGTRQFRITFSYYPNGLQKEEIRYSNDERPAFVAKYEYQFYKSR